MGINLEYMTLLQHLRQNNQLGGGTVLELGAQDISADHKKMAEHYNRFDGQAKTPDIIDTAKLLYDVMGYSTYQAIDATGEYGAHVFDLNENVAEKYNFHEQFDLVTNLGTIEHCFNPAMALENMHKFCKKGGIMIHAFPCSGNANHGLYNMQPRLFALLARACEYEVLSFTFTVDYKPVHYAFSHKNYKAYDDRDLMCYVVYKKTKDNDFIVPFDSIFDDKNQLSGYKATFDINEFCSYIKGSWSNVKPKNLSSVPKEFIQKVGVVRRVFKKTFDLIGGR